MRRGFRGLDPPQVLGSGIRNLGTTKAGHGLQGVYGTKHIPLKMILMT